jgi:DNA-binding MarR family transcriptional regulator
MMQSDDTLARRIADIVPRIMHRTSAQLRQLDETIASIHLRVLALLRRGSLTVGELAEMNSVSAPSMSNTVTTLVKRGWIGRMREVEDRRRVRLELTIEGEAVLEEIQDLVSSHISEAIANLSEQERKQLSAGLDILYQVYG